MKFQPITVAGATATDGSTVVPTIICEWIECQRAYTVSPSAVRRRRRFCSKPCCTAAAKAAGGFMAVHPRLKYRWEPWQLDLLRREYDSQSATIARLVRQIGFPAYTVRHKAMQLGLARSKDRRWTEEDLEYLHAHLATQSYVALARHLGRTTTAIRLQVKRRGITKGSCEGYTAQALARLLGCDTHKVIRWIDRGWLHARRRQTERRNDEYFLSDQDVKTFLVTYRGEIDLRHVERDWFIDLLADTTVRLHRGRGGERAYA